MLALKWKFATSD